uniref:AlNc14C175G8110 protein n=1 Tax=Albugo laibachii Nc14 TaxID=890382 RepID=F0WNV0_9STRA|nr:AlNc14C175G8110 [Albugo laibachii Nc14]|eukprot:CCA22993.1 AlNc14C175G8110 [Albugo laibachii Nc14]
MYDRVVSNLLCMAKHSWQTASFTVRGTIMHRIDLKMCCSSSLALSLSIVFSTYP